MAKYTTYGYDFYFGTIRLPVTPAELTITTPSKNETVTLINDGEINIVKKQGLKEISFSFMLPHQKYPFVKSQDDENMTKSIVSSGIGAITGGIGGMVDSVSSLMEGTLDNRAKFSPAYFIPLLEDLKKYKQVIPFKVYRNSVNLGKSAISQLASTGLDEIGDSVSAMGNRLAVAGVVLGKSAANSYFNSNKTRLPNTNINVVIEDLEFEEDAEEYGRDIMCNITLKEWKPYSTKRYNITENEDGTATVNQTKNRATTKVSPQSVKVKAGDTLWSLCKKYLGDGSKYKEVAKLNGISNPNLIYPSQVIKFS